MKINNVLDIFKKDKNSNRENLAIILVKIIICSIFFEVYKKDNLYNANNDVNKR